MPNISGNLLRIMKEKGVSRTKLCKDTGIAYHTLSRLLRSDGITGHLYTWYTICDYLDIKVGDLFEE